MITCYDIVKTLLRTEKSTRLEPDHKYFFRVATDATKVDIKRAVEEIYKVKVQAVSTIHVAGKRKTCSARSWLCFSMEKSHRDS